MSKRIMTNTPLSKVKHLTFALTFTLVTLFTLSKHTDMRNPQVQSLSACMTVESNLPMNHTNHPCYVSNMSNQSWLSWFAGDSKSTHLHFLDLVELIHYSFH
jgi:hypothetical protein